MFYTLFTCLFTSIAVEGDCKFQAQLMQYCAYEHVFVFVFCVWTLPVSRFYLPVGLLHSSCGCGQTVLHGDGCWFVPGGCSGVSELGSFTAL